MARMKIDFNNFLNLVCEATDEDWRITTGLNLLASYMKEIAERALELEDDVLISILCDMNILKEKDAPDVIENNTEEKLCINCKHKGFREPPSMYPCNCCSRAYKDKFEKEN